MSFNFDPRYFLGLSHKKAYTIKSILAMEGTPPTMNAVSPAEQIIKNFIDSSPESSLKKLETLHKFLFEKKDIAPVFTNSELLDAEQIFHQYTENQKAITKAISLLPESIEMVEDIVEILLKRNETLMKSISDFSPKNLQKQQKAIEKLTPKETDPNFENWSKVKARLFERMHNNSEYYEKLRKLSFKQDKSEALHSLNAIKDAKRNKPR